MSLYCADDLHYFFVISIDLTILYLLISQHILMSIVENISSHRNLHHLYTNKIATNELEKNIHTQTQVLLIHTHSLILKRLHEDQSRWLAHANTHIHPFTDTDICISLVVA